MKIKTKKRGFTLVEIILYIAIVAIIVVVITNFGLDSLKEKSTHESKQIVEQDVTFVINKISHEVEIADKINRFESIFGNLTPNGKLVLNRKNDTVVTISLSNGTVYLREDLNSAIAISSPNLEITTLNFLANISSGNIPKEIQVKITAQTDTVGSINTYEQKFQTSIVPKSADIDSDGCLDIVDQFPVDPACCQDTDGDSLCDNQDNCPLIHNTDQRDDDGDGMGFACDDFVDTGVSGGGTGTGTIIGGTWSGINTVDSCIYSCNYSSPLWQTICKKFECFYTGNKHKFETDEDNDEYAGVGQTFSMDSEVMYWKKTFRLTLDSETISKIDRFILSLNYCHAGSRIKAWWRNARCSGEGYHINGYFDGDQDIEIFNYTYNSWDYFNVLESHLTNNDEIYAEYEFSSNLQEYINVNKEITIRLKFKSNGAAWGDPQRWNFLAPSRYLFLDYILLDVHVQGLAVCGDQVTEMDEQCDDGSQCSDGTDCTASGATVCTGIGDNECKARDVIGDDCSSICLNENAVCGNNLTEVGEECDDDNLINGDGCNANCEVETCGNGIEEGFEECDTGTRCENGDSCSINANCVDIGDEKCEMRNGDDDNCSEFCLNEICGNNRIDYGEECDDGNEDDGDGCNSICNLEWCRNGIEDVGEECDDGKTCSNYEECDLDSDCVTLLGAGETCEIRDNDNCNNSCRIQECGDGIKNRSIEECDDGKQCNNLEKTPCTVDSDCIGWGDELCQPRDIDGCDSSCLIEFAVCGNDFLEFGEECDDSNINDGDGCSHTCMNEYIATYDFTNPAWNGHLNKRTGHTVGAMQQPPNKGPDDMYSAVAYGAPRPYQIEFMTLDDLVPQTPGTLYDIISLEDNYRLQVTFDETEYLDHKFDFVIDEAEFRLDESSAKRIEAIEIEWDGHPELAGPTGLEDRLVYIYVWKNNTWEKVASEFWAGAGWEKTDKIVTAQITNDIDSYIDSNRRLYVLIGVNQKGANMLVTDSIKVNIKAYGYRAGYE